ncbi:MAG: DUF1292 domain-containing protein [Massiliimalia sp.]|jgi:uncharacterized protein YrzB (UPF0473 family)
MANEKDMELDWDLTPEIYTLVDEEGNEQAFELLDVLEIEDNRYFALLPYYENSQEALESDCDLVVLKSEMDGEEELMVPIEDDAEYEKVASVFLEKLASMYEEELEEAEKQLQ